MTSKSSRRQPPALGEFEFVVLLAVLGLKSGAYPLSIRDAIEAKTTQTITLERPFPVTIALGSLTSGLRR